MKNDEIVARLNAPSEPALEGYPVFANEDELEVNGRLFNSYAPPDFWGGWQIIASHIGSVTYNIRYTALGDTLVLGQVRYFRDGGQVTQDFRDDVTITTSDSVANVEVRFMGVPTGSAVRGWVNP